MSQCVCAPGACQAVRSGSWRTAHISGRSKFPVPARSTQHLWAVCACLSVCFACSVISFPLAAAAPYSYLPFPGVSPGKFPSRVALSGLITWTNLLLRSVRLHFHIPISGWAGWRHFSLLTPHSSLST